MMYDAYESKWKENHNGGIIIKYLLDSYYEHVPWKYTMLAL